MADLTCVDGTVLGVTPEPVLDRDDQPYEISLHLTRDGMPFGVVGERCGYFLATLAVRLEQAIADAGPVAELGPVGRHWSSPEDRFPPSALEAGVKTWARDRGANDDDVWQSLARYLPRERTLFAFRRRDPDDPARVGELLCTLRTSKTWVDGGAMPSASGSWQLRERAVLDAWGDAGLGIRAVMTAPELLEFLRTLLVQAEGVGVRYADATDVDLPRPMG